MILGLPDAILELSSVFRSSRANEFSEFRENDRNVSAKVFSAHTCKQVFKIRQKTYQFSKNIVFLTKLFRKMFFI
jgi:hypothetical protein